MYDKSFMKKASFNQKILFFALGAIMTIASIYLVDHYFTSKFPTGFDAGSICNINSFFNCDATSLSMFGSIAGVPIAIFGAMIGAFIMFFYLFSDEENESTLYTTLVANAIGCVLLLLISLIVLKHICPMCTLYYICSWLALYILHKNSEGRGLSVKFGAIYAVTIAIAFGSTFSVIKNKENEFSKRGQQIVTMFKGEPNLGTPKIPSPQRLASASENFEGAPIQMSIFSDFQCPACKALNSVLKHIEKKYAGKINIQYFFYPLDNACNPNIQQSFHTFACRAAYLGYCSPKDKFHEVHDNIFERQHDLTNEWLDTYAKKLGIVDCVNAKETKEAIIKLINQADGFNVKSTPTQLINGVKIIGIRPVTDYFAIMDSILSKK